MSYRFLTLLSLILTLQLTACQKQEEPPAPAAKPAVPPTAGKDTTPADAAKPVSEPAPPGPPLKEDFEGEPKLSLFPRVGDFRPEDTDKEGMSYWATYLDHLSRTSGVLVNKDKTKGRAFGFRGLKAAESVGFFSPLAVEPETSYRVRYRLWSKLPAGAATGVGLLEYDTFLFIPEQFPKSLHDQHFQRSQLGGKVTGEHAGDTLDFTFRTGAKTRMIHLVFFREGTADREPIVIDDIDIRRE